MFLGNGDRKSGTGAFIGYDISDRFAQISFWMPGADKPETLTQVMGEEQYMIPAVLCRRTDRDVWTYGREALKNAAAGDGILVENLLSKARTGKATKGLFCFPCLSNEAFRCLRGRSIRKKRACSFLRWKKWISRPWRCCPGWRR